jgi:ABC-type taurine transport system ATPase subunit
VHRIALTGAHPNPLIAGAAGRIRFSLAQEGPATVCVYDLQGRRVRTVFEGMALQGDQEATWNGTDIVRHPNAIRDVLGYLPQDFGVYPNLSAVELLSYLAAIRGIAARAARERIDELLVLVNLVEARHRPLGGFSGGMRHA